MDTDVATEVPDSLKRLIRLIVRGFYTVETAIVIDMLVRNPCIKEDDMLELLKFERKQLRAIVNSLKVDKILKVRMRVETDREGKTTRHNYYFINYNVFVNVVKYKLDHMRRKIELEERDNTSRASFKCPNCLKSFTDLEVGQLVDPMTGSLQCTYCHTEVEEDESSMPKKDARTTMAKFNEQIQVIYDLLRDCEDIKLAPEILEPEPIDITKLLPRAPSDKNRPNIDAEKMVWSGELSRNNRFGYTDNSITISMDEDEKKTTVQKKEVPEWMAKSTVEGATVTDSQMESSYEAGPSQDLSQLNANDEVMNALLVHEQSKPGAGLRIPTDRVEDNSSSSSEDEAPKPGPSHGVVEEMDSDDEEESVPMVTIGIRKVPYQEVTPDMVEQMTPAEKDEYIRIGQELYSDMYE
ncbi:general transcription factor IIE subunit 1-like [Haliotis cracherodii]|uniref:general transcription factor IIE subunit 1-like n=1 Tax=Haliotis cracherodii TaxID=6455 RepID=UPI0039E76276